MKRPLLAVVLALGLMAAIEGCGRQGQPIDPGTLDLFIDPVPFAGLEALTVTVSRIDIVWTPELGNTELEQVITLSSEPLTLNFVGLPGLTPAAAGGGYPIEPGFITQIRFIVESASAQVDGTTQDVKIPSGPQTGIKVIAADTVIEIKDLVRTEVTARLDVQKSIITNQGQGMLLKPVLHAILGKVTSLPIDKYVPQQLMVLFNPDVTADQVTTLNTQIGATVIHKSPYVNHYLLSLPSTTTVEDAGVFYRASGLVTAAAANYLGTVAQTQTLPNDPSFLNQWALHNIGQTIQGAVGTANADIDAPEAWTIQRGNRGAVVAVVDTGVNTTHADLIPNIYHNFAEIPSNRVDDDGNGYVDDYEGWDFTADIPSSVFPGTMVGGEVAQDTVGHGTGVAGISVPKGTMATGSRE